MNHRLTRLALSVILLAVLALATAPAALGWAPLTAHGSCPSNDQITWTVQASQSESNLNIQFADNAGFVNYSTHALDSTTLSVQVITAASVARAWVRWEGDTSVVSSGVSESCPTPTPSPSATPSATPSPSATPTTTPTLPLITPTPTATATLPQVTPTPTPTLPDTAGPALNTAPPADPTGSAFVLLLIGSLAALMYLGLTRRHVGGKPRVANPRDPRFDAEWTPVTKDGMKQLDEDGPMIRANVDHAMEAHLVTPDVHDWVPTGHETLACQMSGCGLSPLDGAAFRAAHRGPITDLAIRGGQLRDSHGSQWPDSTGQIDNSPDDEVGGVEVERWPESDECLDVEETTSALCSRPQRHEGAHTAMLDGKPVVWKQEREADPGWPPQDGGY